MLDAFFLSDYRQSWTSVLHQNTIRNIGIRITIRATASSSFEKTRFILFFTITSNLNLSLNYSRYSRVFGEHQPVCRFTFHLTRVLGVRYFLFSVKVNIHQLGWKFPGFIFYYNWYFKKEDSQQQLKAFRIVLKDYTHLSIPICIAKLVVWKYLLWIMEL